MPIRARDALADVRKRVAAVRRHRRRERTASPRLAFIATWFAILVPMALVAGGVWFVASAFRGLPDEAALRRIGDMDQATTVYDWRGQLAFTLFKEQRIEVPLKDISPHLIRAIVAVEDQRFYDHHGYDGLRIVSAALANLRRGRAAQGGSTITQQLARQSFLTPDKTFRRKLQELILAGRIERLYSKGDILELYLNKVYFGDGLYGAEAASRGFFGKHASDLSLSEAALLAGLVKSPGNYAPTVSPERAVARRNVVLQAMLDAHAIDRPAWKAARTTKVQLRDSLRPDEPHGQYFKEQVRRELVDRFGAQRVYQGGLRVYSTIDPAMQAEAEAAVATSLSELDGRRKAIAARRAASKPHTPPTAPEPPLQAALVSMDPTTGEIRAMVGGRDFNESRFNRAIQARRQPGSAFKPFVYAVALEQGFTPSTIIDHLDDPITTVRGAWTPEDEHSTAASMTMRTALRTSSNRAAVRMLQQVGIGRTVEYAQALGIGDLPKVPSLALGSGEVTLQSMTAAYAAFANHGLVPRPFLIRRVEDQAGAVLFETEAASTHAVSDVTAFLMSTMMADVINAGTGAGARRVGFVLPAAGKTGTTNDFNDAWFVGYTPKLATGVWVGFDQPKTILPNGFAADVAVPMWARYMKEATKGDPPTWVTRPAGVVSVNVCRLSGKLAGEGCDDVEVVEKNGRVDHRSMVYTEYFAAGTEPNAYCDMHPTPGIFGKLASAVGAVSTPPPLPVEELALPPAPVSTAGAAPVATAAAPDPAPQPDQPPKKKRGFWSKVFGLGHSTESEKK
jgi:penicillin-binding protein 1A